MTRPSVLFWQLIAVSLRSQMQYRASFVMQSVGHFLGTFIDLVGIWALFHRFHTINGWTFFEVGLIYGIVHMGFALAEGLGRGFDTFGQMVKQGDFDRLLLRPLSPLLQVAAREIELLRLGRFFQGGAVLLWSASQLSFSLFSLHALVILLSILGTASLFYGLMVLQGALTFWTVETLELMNIATYGGLQTGQFPLSIYPFSFRLVFTLIIPLACVAYYPVATLLHHTSLPLWLGALAPFAGGVFLFLSCQVWHWGVKHYCSTGS